MRRTLAKFGLPFEKATPLVHLQKARICPRNNAGPASYYYYYYLLLLLLLLLFYEKRLHAVYKLQKDVCHNLWRAQTALIHYTRGPAE